MQETLGELMSSDIPGTNTPGGSTFPCLDFYENKGLMTGQHGEILDYEYTLSITDNPSKDNTIKIYPNPVNDNFTFTSYDTMIDEVQIIDLNGKVSKIIKHPTNNNNIQCSDLKSGIYILRIISGKAIAHELFIKN